MGGRAPEGNLAGKPGGTGAAVALALRGGDEPASGAGRSAGEARGGPCGAGREAEAGRGAGRAELGWAWSRGGLKRSRPGGARASWAEVGPREGRGRPGPRWAGPGLLLGWVLVVGLGLGWVEGLGFLFPILLLSKSNSNKV